MGRARGRPHRDGRGAAGLRGALGLNGLAVVREMGLGSSVLATIACMTKSGACCVNEMSHG